MHRSSRGRGLSLIVGLGLLVASSISAKPQPPGGVSLDPAKWLIHNAAWTPATHPLPLVGMSGWYFDVPDPSDSVNYVMVPFTTPMTQAQSVTFAAQIVATSGVPIFHAAYEPGNTCDPPPTTRAHFARIYTTGHGKNGVTQEEYSAPDNYRWWTNPVALLLAEGTATVTVPLNPAQWSDANGTFGDVDPIGFAAALASPGTIGFTFGGGCFFGHGVYVDGGTARFLVTSYTVQP